MNNKNIFLFLIFVQIVQLISAQENAGTGVASYLINCYNNSALPGVVSGNGRPPATLNILIEYIRKLEDANPNLGARQLSLLLMQRFRQDGIKRTALNDNIDLRFGIPYSASRLEAFKNRIFLRSMIPSIQQTLNLGELTDIEKCSLHFMISSSIDERVRGDENSVCSRTSRYTSRIVRRKRDVEFANTNLDDFGVFSTASLSSNNISQCPIELGVVYTPYGTVKTGQVLAGITTGLNPQIVLNSVVDNRYAATLAGELTEAALYQARENVDVGAQGGWNSTINPRYYFLQTNNLLQCTDAEIRGSLDGLYMGLQMTNWTSRFSDIKISQILDMYYSPYQQGVLDNYIRACSRNALYTDLTSTETVTNQVLAFMPILNTFAVFGNTLSNSSFATFTQGGMSSFNSYLPQMSNDLFCLPENKLAVRGATDLLIFIDSTWTFRTVQSVLSYILDNIDVNKFGSRYTLYSATGGWNVTNTTNYLSAFHEQYNETVHNNMTNGFNYVTVFQVIEQVVAAKLNNNSYNGGESTIALLVTRNGLNDQRDFVTQRRAVINNNMPNLNFLVLGSGSQSDYDAIVTNPSNDVIILSETTNEDSLKIIGQDVVNSIKNIPRSVINPNCGASFNGAASTLTLTEYVEPQGVNYYNISANYFFTGSGTRYLKVREMSFGTINVCISRDHSKPDNTTSSCQSLRSSEQSLDITGYCDGYYVSTCPSIYIAVFGTSSDLRCPVTDSQCRFPTQVKYTISMENVGCASGAQIYYLSTLMLIILTGIATRF